MIVSSENQVQAVKQVAEEASRGNPDIFEGEEDQEEHDEVDAGHPLRIEFPEPREERAQDRKSVEPRNRQHVEDEEHHVEQAAGLEQQMGGGAEPAEKVEQHAEDHEQHEVGRRPGEGDQSVAVAMAHQVGPHGDRAPGDAADGQHDQRHRPHLFERIERQVAGVGGGGVALHERDPGVHELVAADREDDHQQPGEEELRIGEQIRDKEIHDVTVSIQLDRPVLIGRCFIWVRRFEGGEDGFEVRGFHQRFEFAFGDMLDDAGFAEEGAAARQRAELAGSGALPETEVVVAELPGSGRGERQFERFGVGFRNVYFEFVKCVCHDFMNIAGPGRKINPENRVFRLLFPRFQLGYTSCFFTGGLLSWIFSESANRSIAAVSSGAAGIWRFAGSLIR